MTDYIDEIVKAVCDNVVVNSECADFDIDDYIEVRERIIEILGGDKYEL